MYSELKVCIIIAVVISIICVIAFVKKMKKLFVAVLLLALFFIFRSILLWMAAGYTPPTTVKPETEIDVPLEVPDIDFSLPKPHYYNNGSKGYGAH